MDKTRVKILCDLRNRGESEAIALREGRSAHLGSYGSKKTEGKKTEVPRWKRATIVILSLVVAALLAALLYAGYLFGIISFADKSALTGNGYASDYAVAVIQTSRQKPSTFIEYYDKDLNLLTSLEYPFGTTQSPWGELAVYDGVVYMTPQTTNYVTLDSFVAALDMQTGEIQEIDADGGVTNVAVNDDYVFAAAQGGIGRVDRQTGEVLSIDQKGRNFPFASGDKLYVFNDERTHDKEAGAYLTIYDIESMELLEDIYFGDESDVPRAIGFIGDRLYFTSVLDSDDVPRENKRWNLSYYSLTDGEVHILTTVVGMRMETAAFMNGEIYVSTGGDNAPGADYFKILVINEESGEVEHNVPLNYCPMYFYVNEEVLYASGHVDENNYDRSYLFSYETTEDGFAETGKVLLPLHNTTEAVYGFTGMFAPSA